MAQHVQKQERSLHFKYIYKISSDEAEANILHKKDFTRANLHTLVDSFPDFGYRKKYAPAYYLEVSPNALWVSYNLFYESDLNVILWCENKQLNIRIRDTKTNHFINDAELRINNALLDYSFELKSYLFKGKTNKKILKIKTKSECFFLELEKESNYPDKDKAEYGSGSFIAINKPVYRIGDTVKVRGLIVDKKGKFKKGKTEFRFKNYGKVFHTKELEISDKGIFNYSFVLGDSLALDSWYIVEADNYSGTSFYLEDYELKSIFCDVKMQSDFYKNDSVFFHVSANDANGFPIPDAVMSYKLYPEKIEKTDSNYFFIPFESTVKQGVELDDVKATKISLDSFMIKGAQIRYKLEVEITYGANEVKKIDKLFSYGGEKVVEEKREIEYDVYLKHHYLNDSIHLTFENEGGLTFEYSVDQEGKNIEKGENNNEELKMIFPIDFKKNVNIQYEYFNGEMKVKKNTITPETNRLKLVVEHPDSTLPGAVSEIKIKAFDHHMKPVENAAVFSRIVNNKFEKNNWKPLKYSSSHYRKKDNEFSKVEAELKIDRIINKDMDAEYAKRFGYDTLHTVRIKTVDSLYFVQHKIFGDFAQFFPFLRKGPLFLRVYAMYCDDQLVFYGNYQNEFSCIVPSGKHNIKIVTKNQNIYINNLEFLPGHKLEIALNMNKAFPFVKTEKRKTKFSKKEIQEITSFYAYIKGHNGKIRLNGVLHKMNYSGSFIGPIKQNFNLFAPEDTVIVTPGKSYNQYYNSFDDVKELEINKKLKYFSFPSIESRTGEVLPIKESSSTESNYSEYYTYPETLVSKGEKATLLFNTNEEKEITHIELHGINNDFFACRNKEEKDKYVYDRNITFYSSVYYGKQPNVFADLLPGKYQLKLVKENGGFYWSDTLVVKAGGTNYFYVNPRKWNSFSKNIPTYNIVGNQLNLTQSKGEGKIKFDVNFIDGKKVESYVNIKLQQHGSIRVTSSVQNSFNGELSIFKRGIYDLIFEFESKYIIIQNLYLDTANTYHLSLTDSIPSSGSKNISAYVLNGNKYFKTTGKTDITANDFDIVNFEKQRKLTEKVKINKTENKSYQKYSTKEELVSGQHYYFNGQEEDFNKPYVYHKRKWKKFKRKWRKFWCKTLGLCRRVGHAYKLKGVGGNYSPKFDAIAKKEVVGTKEENPIMELKGISTDRRSSDAVNSIAIKRLPDDKNGKKEEEILNDDLEKFAGGARSAFNDEAAFPTVLFSDKNGEITYSVRYPDDITQWKIESFVINENHQTGSSVDYVKAYKNISAQLAVPRFLLKGDSVEVIGRLLNLRDDNHFIKSTFFSDSISIKSFADSLDKVNVYGSWIKANKDSLSLSFMSFENNKLIDGERRPINVYPVGVEIAKGEFYTLKNDSSLSITIPKQFENYTISIMRSHTEVMLNKIDRITSYGYNCNEQMASKIMALLYKRKVYEVEGRIFTEHYVIRKFIKELGKTRNTQNLWGWWYNGYVNTELTSHVLKALKMANDQGYTVSYLPESERLFKYYFKILSLDEKFDAMLNFENNTDSITSFLNRINTNDLSLYQKVMYLKLQQKAGLEIKWNLIAADQKSTVLGGIYYGNVSYSLYDNRAVITSEIYQLMCQDYLKSQDPSKKKTMDLIIQYFLEPGNVDCWRNTYESIRTISNILPGILEDYKRGDEMKVSLSGAVEMKLEQFPLFLNINKNLAGKTIDINKKGLGVLFVSCYEISWQNNPKKNAELFDMSYALKYKGKDTSEWHTANNYELVYTVIVKKADNYVMLELPVPASCSYNGKPQYYSYHDAHREYFRDKVVVFADKLLPGTYTYSIPVQTRFKGFFTMNPAKTSLMYFPIFYGNSEQGKTEVK